jgi:hypothetical protein
MDSEPTATEASGYWREDEGDVRIGFDAVVFK